MPSQSINAAELERCIQRCTECHKVCLETIAHCLRLGGQHASAEHIGLLMNCAMMCETSAKFMISRSKFHHRTCEVCAEVCEACAADCRRLAGGDRQMQICADVCDDCARTCHEMAGAMAQ